MEYKGWSDRNTLHVHFGAGFMVYELSKCTHKIKFYYT